jgi:hypothetical protein
MNRSRLGSLIAAGAITVGALVGVTAQASIAQAQPIDTNGEAGTCWYDGKQYSEGAKITLQDGTVQTCQHDGTWKRIAPQGNNRLPRPPVLSFSG